MRPVTISSWGKHCSMYVRICSVYVHICSVYVCMYVRIYVGTVFVSGYGG